MTYAGKLMPNFDQQTTKILNLTVLQRIDSSIEEILLTSAHVTFYQFNIDHNQWSRKDVEGSLFVVKRNTQPRFQFIVMNRRNTDNLVENLLDFEYEVQVPYLLYRNASQEVNGIWFYNSHECEDVANLFSRILNAYSKVPPNLKVSSTKSEFEELERVPTTEAIEGPLEPLSTSSTAIDVPEDSSFVNFISAMNAGNHTSNSTYPGQSYTCPTSVPLCMSVRNNALNVTSLEHPYACPTLVSLPSHIPSMVPSPAIPPQFPQISFSASSTSQLPFHEFHDPIGNINKVTNLVKPSFFVPPSSSSLKMPHMSISSSISTVTLNPSINLQRQYGTPMLQPFPPPNPPASLTTSLTYAPSYGPSISRDMVRDALLMLVQDNQFIEMFYQALMRDNSL